MVASLQYEHPGKQPYVGDLSVGLCSLQYGMVVRL